VVSVAVDNDGLGEYADLNPSMDTLDEFTEKLVRSEQLIHNSINYYDGTHTAYTDIITRKQKVSLKGFSDGLSYSTSQILSTPSTISLHFCFTSCA